jgi:glyoxylase-like metal-dependent hydrolase (beta-lactamase superfamily II)
MDGHTVGLRGRLACHCLLVETAHSLVLIDTGFGTHDVATPLPRLSSFFLALVAPDFREELTAIRQIERLGFHARDVRHIVLTHLDFDHAGGLDDFPNARVHLMSKELLAAQGQRTWLDRQRYRPQQWQDRRLWSAHSPLHGERWFGFECVRELAGLPPEILLIPLRGHTFGHAGVAIQTGEGWLLQAGDAYFFHDEMDLERPRCTPGLRFYQWMLEKDRTARLGNQERLRQLKREHGSLVRVTSSHDVEEFVSLAHRGLTRPVEPVLSPAPAMGGVYTPMPDRDKRRSR